MDDTCQEFRDLLGLPVEKAHSALKKIPTVAKIRTSRPDGLLTSDFVEDRVTLLVDDGKVVQVFRG